MRSKDVDQFVTNGESPHELELIVKNVQLEGIELLDLSTTSQRRNDDYNYLRYALPKLLPNLLEVDASNTVISESIDVFSIHCPLLEKVTSSNNASDIRFYGSDMRHSKDLKAIYMDNALSIRYFFSMDDEKIADLNNHQDIFLFHRCCKSLEHVLVWNMN
jgi:hypothetical protein